MFVSSNNRSKNSASSSSSGHDTTRIESVKSPETSAKQRPCSDEEIEKALNCSCVKDLRTGPCAIPFEGALVCYMKSDKQEKGRECYDEFLQLHSCLQESNDIR